MKLSLSHFYCILLCVCTWLKFCFYINMALFHSVTFPLGCRDASRQHVLSYNHARPNISPRYNTSNVYDHWTTMHYVQCIISAPFWHVHFISNYHVNERFFTYPGSLLFAEVPSLFIVKRSTLLLYLIACHLDDQWSLALEGTIDRSHLRIALVKEGVSAVPPT